MGIAIIIPTLNADTTLSATLQSIGKVEQVIIVDGGSQDSTLRLAHAAKAQVLYAPKGRGQQLRAGAEAANQEWLLFLHADTRLQADWRKHVDAFINRGDAAQKAGVFRFRLDSTDWQARILESLVAMRVCLFALPYGDQGLLIHQSLYKALGGFRPLPIMEDVDLIRRIGRHRLKSMPCAATTSARRWHQEGWLARSTRNLICLTLFSIGTPINQIARYYER